MEECGAIQTDQLSTVEMNTLNGLIRIELIKRRYDG